MSDSTIPSLDPTDGTTPISLPTQDSCCQVPCDPPWLPGPTCFTVSETKTITLPLGAGAATSDLGRGLVIITLTYVHRLCLVGKRHGPLIYTLTLLPGEKATLYHSDRFRRTTTDTERFSVQATFFQFVSALDQQQTSNDSSFLSQVLNSSTQSASKAGGGGLNLGLFSIGESGGLSSSSSKNALTETTAQASAERFHSLARQASQYVDLQRSTTISTYEDAESVSTTQRTLVNNNACYAVNYFVRKVMDVYDLTTAHVGITFQVKSGNYTSPVLTPAQVNSLPAPLRNPVKAILASLPVPGQTSQIAQAVNLPTDGVVYDPELAHCCVQDPALEQEVLIRLEREQADAQRIGLENQLIALEVQRRQALIAAGTLTPFEPAPSETIVA